MIAIENLRYRTLVIDNLRISPGITSVIGPNGSGKTTFLKLLAGITLPESGSIKINGNQPRETKIGWVSEFPDRNILFGSAFDEIASPLRFRHMPCSETNRQVESIMVSVGISELKPRLIRGLSGGEKVLVALAAALVIRPEVLVLDEYDSHLDAHRASQIADLIRESGVPYVIHCTQDTDAAARGDQVIFLENGIVSRTGTPDEVFAQLTGSVYYPPSWMCRP